MAADTQGNKQDGGGVAAETHLQWTWKRCLYGLDSALADIFYQTLVRAAGRQCRAYSFLRAACMQIGVLTQ